MDKKNFLNGGVPDEVMESFKKTLDNPVELQVFKTFIHDNNIEDAKEEHAEEIIKHIVHSKYCQVRIPGIGIFYSMSGFVEQTGRTPTADDEIRIFKGDHYFTICDSKYILSEIGFEIVRKKILGTVRGDFKTE